MTKPPTPTNTRPDDPIIDANIEAAARLIDMHFTPSERAQMVEKLKANRASYDQLRSLGLGNAEVPAFHFNPRPPGYQPPVQATIRAREASVVSRPDNLEELAFSSIAELGALLRQGAVTAVELTEMYLTRLKRHGPLLRCVAQLTEDLALAQATQADAELAAGHDRGPLHGIPYGAKDLLATRSHPTGWGAPPFRGQRTDFNATVIDRLVQAGAILVAKLSLGSLAWSDIWYGGKTKTPWDVTKGSSGSSAGSGAATAAGLVAFAIGSETNGSIVSPSTECGLTGLRPTFGRVSRSGAMTLAWTLDKLGPMCRSADDCALVFDAIRGPDGLDATVVDAPFAWEPEIDLRGMRIGYLVQEIEAAEATRDLDRATVAALEQLGAEMVPLDLPDAPLDALEMIVWIEAATAFDELTRSGRDDELIRQSEQFWPNQFRAARLVPAVEYLQAQRARTQLIADLNAVMQNVDLYVAPSYCRNLWLTNATGHPAVVVPNGFRASGLPSTVTLIGHYDDEARLLAVAKAYQAATDFNRQVPPDFAP